MFRLGKVRILIVDDHTLFREGVTGVLNAEPNFEVVAHCASVEEAIGVISTEKIDIVLLDFVLGREMQFDFFHDAHRIGFDGRVLIVTARLSETEGAELIRLGASGIFMKHDSTSALSQGIRQVMNGQTWFDQQSLKTIFEISTGKKDSVLFPAPPLTVREREVLKLISEGSTNRQIAARLGTSEGSVKATVRQLFAKVNVRTRSQLVRAALQLQATER